MSTQSDNLAWRNIETDELSNNALDLYNTYKLLQRQAAVAREAFEAEFQHSLGLTPTSPQRIVFGYKFGKLSIAVAPNDRPKPSPKRSTTTLADFLASARLTGARV